MELAALATTSTSRSTADGDRFSVVYDQLYKDGKKLRDGDIVAAEFVNRGQAYRAMRYVDADGNATYYTPEGASFRKAFIRTPVDFIRISSGFTTGRLHPILNVIRAHKGVDYAAAIGTPVKATGDGIVDLSASRRLRQRRQHPPRHQVHDAASVALPCRPQRQRVRQLIFPSA